MKPHLSQEQRDLLESLSTNYSTGSKSNVDTNEMNIITPPWNLPKWACVILPCINHLPTMKLYKKIIPVDAEVRLGNRWVCYDSSSLGVGDIVRIHENDIVPADLKLLSLGPDLVADGEEDLEEGNNDCDVTELIVDASAIDGVVKPRTITMNRDGTVDAEELNCGSVVLQGEAIAVVTKVGKDVLLSRLIQGGKWPPKENKGWQAVNQDDEDEVQCEQELV